MSIWVKKYAAWTVRCCLFRIHGTSKNCSSSLEARESDFGWKKLGVASSHCWICVSSSETMVSVRAGVKFAAG